MPKVTIDGQSIEVPEGTTILQAARMMGGPSVPPAMCYYSKLETSGGYCRTCIVKVTKGSEKDPRPMPKPVASCRTPIMDGMEVQNLDAPDLLEARKGVVEFLLINHQELYKFILLLLVLYLLKMFKIHRVVYQTVH